MNESSDIKQNVMSFLMMVYSQVANDIDSSNEEPTQISQRGQQQPLLQEEKPVQEGVLSNPTVAPPMQQNIREVKKKESTQATQRSIKIPPNFETHGEGALEDTSEGERPDPPSIPYQKEDPNLHETFEKEAVEVTNTE